MVLAIKQCSESRNHLAEKARNQYPNNMDYTFDKLADVAECDRVLERANLEKSEMQH